MTDTTSQPITFFDEAEHGSVKGMQKDTGAKSTDLWMVPYDEIRIADGFNIRVQDRLYDDHIAYLAGQMVERGYDKTKPMAGYVVKENGKNVVYVTDGHSRHAAVAKAREAGAAIDLIPVIVHPPGTSAEDLTIALVTANSGKPLSPFEIATVCKRLQGYGYDAKQIAQKLGYTKEYINNLFDLLAAPKAVRDMVTDGKVSATLAVQTVRKHGKDAAKVLKEGAAEAAAKGKTKVTGKHVKKAATKAPVPAKKAAAKKAAPPVEQPVSIDNNERQAAIDLIRRMADYIRLVSIDNNERQAAIDLIRRMADYIRLVRVGDDAADLLSEADSLIGDNADDSQQQGELALDVPADDDAL
jgi:ParB-like chromosome segregation protein Spo0J